jgi:small subunit ribosomal protein S13
VYNVLADIQGLGSKSSLSILYTHGIQKTYPFGRLTLEQKNLLTRQVMSLDPEKKPIMNNLTTLKKDSINSHINVRSYKGFRHLVNLPVRGQRTRTNARTQKNYKSKAMLLRTSYRNKKRGNIDKNSQNKKFFAETSNYNKPLINRARARKFFFN